MVYYANDLIIYLLASLSYSFASIGVQVARKSRFYYPLSFLSERVAHNVGVCDGRGIGGFKNAAKRNVKPDHHVLVTRHKTI